jgi:uncharacterized protein
MIQDSKGNLEKTGTISWEYKPNHGVSGFPWGPHRLPVKIEVDGISIGMERTEGGYLYNREDQSGKYEKKIIADKGSFYLSPVEPMHHPPGVSKHLLIKLDQPLILEPRSNQSHYLTFPLEIASVFNRKRVGETVLDVFSLHKTKLTLYGSFKRGLICRFWQSNVFSAIPSVNPLEEGIIQLTINNSGNRWAEVKQAVFSAQAMKIYYSAQLAAMQAIMKINSEITAETAFVDEPLKPGMHKAPEQFNVRLLSLSGRLVMEEGY